MHSIHHYLHTFKPIFKLSIISQMHVHMWNTFRGIIQIRNKTGRFMVLRSGLSAKCQQNIYSIHIWTARCVSFRLDASQSHIHCQNVNCQSSEDLFRWIVTVKFRTMECWMVNVCFIGSFYVYQSCVVWDRLWIGHHHTTHIRFVKWTI